ncbi:MAG: hypothetical protein ACLPJY_14900, partial [Rhodomicrobium sp.]
MSVRQNPTEFGVGHPAHPGQSAVTPEAIAAELDLLASRVRRMPPPLSHKPERFHRAVSQVHAKTDKLTCRRKAARCELPASHGTKRRFRRSDGGKFVSSATKDPPTFDDEEFDGVALGEPDR